MTGSDSPAEETPSRYRNPPSEHRFRKGVSGNPKGRPRKIGALVATKIGGKPGIGFEDRVKSLAIEEAYRIIKIREGDRVERIPVIQAILRKIAVAAANGNTRAQQTYLNLLIGAESDRRMATMELFAYAVEYKEHWGRVLTERARKGTTGPEPVPHPDDVIIDSKTGEVRFEGPVSEVENAAQEWLRANSMEFIENWVRISGRLESEPNNLELRKEQKELAKIIDWIRNDALKRSVRDALRRPPGKLRKDG
jgi:Family of unknown function (DUF5681)